MPIGRSRNGAQETNIDQTGTARFLFGDDEPSFPRGGTPDDHFPTLVRRDGQMVSSIFLSHSCLGRLVSMNLEECCLVQKQRMAVVQV